MDEGGEAAAATTTTIIEDRQQVESPRRARLASAPDLACVRVSSRQTINGDHHQLDGRLHLTLRRWLTGAPALLLKSRLLRVPPSRLDGVELARLGERR